MWNLTEQDLTTLPASSASKQAISEENMLKKINLIKDKRDSIHTSGLLEKKKQAWAIFDMQWPILKTRKVSPPTQTPCRVPTSMPLAPVWPPPSTGLGKSRAPPSSLTGSWFTSFNMPSPSFIHHPWTFKAIKFRNFQQIFFKFTKRRTYY